ncbi:hypothetical protein TNCT_167061 [Trichonephila clavata]|uniref:Uncharacterized protein n=1 Tax=Trichonephila clavata TaxID=2740835 RepID=A0A8X6LM02_TRICU|nr:hypothetical protein TNCT_167061 [Trichonephila clavata]
MLTLYHRQPGRNRTRSFNKQRVKMENEISEGLCVPCIFSDGGWCIKGAKMKLSARDRTQVNCEAAMLTVIPPPSEEQNAFYSDKCSALK